MRSSTIYHRCSFHFFKSVCLISDVIKGLSAALFFVHFYTCQVWCSISLIRLLLCKGALNSGLNPRFYNLLITLRLSSLWVRFNLCDQLQHAASWLIAASTAPTALLSSTAQSSWNTLRALIFSHPPWQRCHVLYSSADQTLWKQPLKPVLQRSVSCACQIRMPEFCFGMKIYISNSCILVCWGWPTTVCGLRVWLAVIWPSPQTTFIFSFFSLLPPPHALMHLRVAWTEGTWTSPWRLQSSPTQSRQAGTSGPGMAAPPPSRDQIPSPQARQIASAGVRFGFQH